MERPVGGHSATGGGWFTSGALVMGDVGLRSLGQRGIRRVAHATGTAGALERELMSRRRCTAGSGCGRCRVKVSQCGGDQGSHRRGDLD